MQLRHRALTGTTNRSNDVDLSQEDKDYPSAPTPESHPDCSTTCSNEVISEENIRDICISPNTNPPSYEDVMDNIEKYPGSQNTVMPEIAVP